MMEHAAISVIKWLMCHTCHYATSVCRYTTQPLKKIDRDAVVQCSNHKLRSANELLIPDEDYMALTVCFTAATVF